MEGVEHDDDPDVVFKDEPPKVDDGAIEWHLSHDVGILPAVALHLSYFQLDK